ncbi:hypothetical protein [Gulosibacter molinativorax]|uniref:Tetratricopeptide repeat protein n=1 Tax=Gulosibacter molinativorax TaxID=256821 RepID=A0ABT7C489_9MICO|nr:hypothetical protein [Gulosibacter molinativorax]MDJ1369855.1 hypothetical protein [Gulosibacter molinativorax]QUY61820.1 Hypotetical protein [Gulosibacter molinativorax]
MKPVTTLRKLRRRILLWSLPVVLLAGALGVLLIGQHFVAKTAIAQHQDEKHEEALNTSGQLALINLVERWKPHYNMGTSYLELDALAEAGAQFTTALELAAPAEQCPIRANFAITLEREGDKLLAEGSAEGAYAKYEEAIALIEAQDPACDQSTSNRSLDDSHERILEKLQQFEQSQPQPDQQDPESTPQPEQQPNPDALDELENGLDENKENRDQDVQENDNYGGGSGGSVDEPW